MTRRIQWLMALALLAGLTALAVSQFHAGRPSVTRPTGPRLDPQDRVTPAPAKTPRHERDVRGTTGVSPAEAGTGSEWPMFHGNAGLSGVSNASLPDKPELLWRFKTGGTIGGSPAIAGGRVYIGSDDEKVYAVNLKDGTKAWEFKTGGPVLSSPCVAGGCVFVGSGDAQLYALDAAAGTLRWQYATQGDIKAGPTFADGASLGVARPAPTPTPSPERFGGAAPFGRVLIGSYDNKLHCVDAATGEAVWTLATGNYVNGSAAISQGKTVFGGCDALLHIVDVKTGAETAKVEAGAYIAASAALYGNIAYVGHYEHEFLAIDIQKAAVLWRFDNPHEFPFFSSPAVTKERVVVGSRDKRVHCLDRATGKELWTFMTRGKVDSSPVIVRDRVIAASEDGRVYILSLETGKELWAYDIGSPVDSSPAVTDGMFVIGADDGVLYAFGAMR